MCFFLYRQQRHFWNTVKYLWTGFLAKKSYPFSCWLFFQKSSTIDFRLVQNTTLGNTVKKYLFKRHFHNLKLFYLYYHILFSDISEKRVTDKNKRLNPWSLLITWGTQFLILADWIIENDICQTLAWFLKFLSSGGVLDCFLQPNILLNLCKKLLTCPKLLKWASMVNFEWPKVIRITINVEQLKVSKITSLKIYISQVMEKLETSNLDIR